MEITPEQLDTLGRLADTAENYAAASRLPMPPAFHVEQLRAGLEDLAAQIKQVYVVIAGENPWDAGAGGYNRLSR